MFRHVALVLAIFAFPFAEALAFPGGSGARTPVQDSIQKHLEKLADKLASIERKKAYAPLFESEHKDIVRMQAMFTCVEKAVHEARKAAADGDEISVETADLFHNGLREYELNVEEMEASGAFGDTKAPDARKKKKLLKLLGELRDEANAIPGFQEAALTEPTSQANAADAVRYAKRSLTEVYWLLEYRTMAAVTSFGRREATGLRAALDAVWTILDDTVDDDGNLILRYDDDDRPLRDQLAPFKAAMEEARSQAKFYRKLYLPNVRQDAHRRRALAIEERLSEKGFERSFLAVKALTGAAPAAKKR